VDRRLGVHSGIGMIPFEDYEVQFARGEVVCPAIPAAPCHTETVPGKGRLTQLLTSDGGCWKASYTTPLRNDEQQFSAKSD
jgi:hypothetical protein